MADLPAPHSPMPLGVHPSESRDDIVAELIQMIAHRLDVRLEEHEIDATMPLLDGGLMLDSMVLFELITLVEQRYGITFPGDGLDPAMFANLTVLAEHILTMRSSS